jgi:hypothetical protein
VSRPTIERAAAAAAWRIRYFTGRPCKYGHIAERFTSDGGCVECRAGVTPEQREARRVYMNKYTKSPEQREAARERKRRAWSADPAKARQAQQNYRARKRAEAEAQNTVRLARVCRATVEACRRENISVPAALAFLDSRESDNRPNFTAALFERRIEKQ